MASEEEVRLIIKAATENAVSNLQKLNDKMEETTRRSTSQVGIADKLKSSWLTTAAVFGGAAIALGKMVSAGMESEKAELRLAGAMKNAGTYTQERYQHLKNLAGQIQKTTTYEDEEVMGVQRVLSQYKLEGQALDDLTQATVDYAAAKGIDLASAADLMGRAVNGATDSVRGLSVNLKDVSSRTERANMVAKELADTFGGAAATAADTASGRLKQAQIAMGDIAETIGSLALPAVKAISEAIKAAADWFQGLSSSAQSVVIGIGLAGVAIALLTKLVIAFGVSFSAAIWPVTLIVAAIAGVVVAVKNWDTIVRVAARAWDYIVFAAQTAWGYIKIVFLGMAEMAVSSAAQVIQPFISAFNTMIDGYNTVTGAHKEHIDNVVAQGAEYLEKQIEQTQLEIENLRIAEEEKQIIKDENKAIDDERDIAKSDQIAVQQENDYAKLMANLKKKYAAAKGYTNSLVKLDTDYYKFRLQQMGFDADNYTTFSNFIMTNADKNSKWQFKLWQAMSIAQTVVYTYQAAIAAFAAMAGIPYVGPALGVAAAAAAVAMGLGMVAKIASTKPGGAEEGGIIRGAPGNGTLFYAGEHNKSEAIIPLENPEAQEKLGGLGGTTQVNFNMEYLIADRDFPMDVAKEIDKALYKLRQQGQSRLFA